MNILHDPIFDVATIERHYTNKDGVPVKYVCTSALDSDAFAMDIFFRETPHPHFGNKYFGSYWETIAGERLVKIANADAIEDDQFGMISHNGQWVYSQHRHDFRSAGNCIVDGGRAYFKRVGDLSVECKHMTLREGHFVEVEPYI